MIPSPVSRVITIKQVLVDSFYDQRAAVSVIYSNRFGGTITLSAMDSSDSIEVSMHGLIEAIKQAENEAKGNL